MPIFTEHFRGHIFRRPTKRISQIILLKIVLRQPKISENNMPFKIKQDVFWLQISVNYVPLMQVLQC